MSVTKAKGFKAAGIAVGLKTDHKPDLALVVNEGPAFESAVVFTSNRAQANPIIWSKQAHQETNAKAIILNSGGANCFTGEFGYETTRLTAAKVAQQLAIETPEVLVCSTGLIGSGDIHFRNKILNGVAELAENLSDNGSLAANAILTTDSIKKEFAYTAPSGWSVGGMAKGAGMLAPGLATMLVVLTTDAVVESQVLQRCLAEAVRLTFNRLDSDGCMSTNDQVTLLASKASNVVPEESEFLKALIAVCQELTYQLQSDAEGASHDIEIQVLGAASEADAEEVGRSVARNNLFKTAIFGNDPNWGRVLAAIGTTRATFDPYRVDVSFNGVRLCSNGAPDRPVEDCDLSPRKTTVVIELNAGSKKATILTNDLTHDYVHENSAYSS